MSPHLVVATEQQVGPAESASRALEALSRSGDSDLQEIVNLVHSICEVESAAISILHGDEYHLIVTAGIDPLVCSADDTLCVNTMDCHFGVFVEDASRDERFRTSPYVDGTYLALRFYASAPIYAPSGDMVGRLCLFDHRSKVLNALQEQTLTTLAANVSGVLELRMRQQEEAHQRAETMAASEEVLRVAAQISHDMRIPLTALTTSLDMLHESHPADIDPVRLRVFNSARRSAQRMSRMVEGILRLNDVERSIHLSKVDLSKVAHQVVADAGAELQQARASVKVEHLPTVRADAGQMYSLLLNLVTNSVKFARPGVPPVIRFTSQRTKNGWRISVLDNGSGIPAEKRAEVFSMFSRLDTSVEGHGIGLATVARIVGAHGGQVGAKDAPDHGTEIWFELPDR